MRLLALIAIGLGSCVSAAWSDPCSFTPQTTALPQLQGRVVFEDFATGQLYVYDFKTNVLTNLLVSYWGLTSATNPVFSPDGSGILFSAVVGSPPNDQRHLFYWKIGTGLPINLTGGMGNLRNEDPKFSSNGARVLWKQNNGIETADFSFDDLGRPALLHPTQVIGSSPEASGPVFSPTQKYIYYFRSNGTVQQLWRYDSSANPPSTAPAFSQDPSIQYYYPADPDLYDFLYVSWLPTAVACPHCDKIYVRTRLPDAGTPWNPTDCAADNSDPAPVDEDYFIYSRDRNPDGNSSYELYLGQLSTGSAWKLNISIASSSLLGSNYTNVRPPTP